MQHIILLLIIPALLFLACYLLWQHKGKDDPGRQTVIPEYQPPHGLSPAEIGLLHDFKVSDREITATLVDLAIRGYIQIHKIPKKSVFGDHIDYAFELTNDDVLNLKNFEQALLNGLFGVATVKFNAKMQASLTNLFAKEKAQKQYPASTESFVGRTVELDELKPYFYQNVDKAKFDLNTDLYARGFFKSYPLSAGVVSTSLGVILLCIAIFFKGDYLISALLSSIILIGFGSNMGGRTKTGKLLAESIDGFAMYLRTAERYRLMELQGPKSNENSEVVNLYESYLPYAIALGVEADWNKHFKGVYGEPPRWFEWPVDEILELVSSVHAGFEANKS